MEKEIFYTPSGKSPIVGFYLALIIGSLLCIVLAYVYNVFTVIIPAVYVNLFICIGFGITIGFIVRYFSRIAKIRSKQQIIMLASIIGIIAWYFQWIAYFIYLITDDISWTAFIDNIGFFHKPSDFINILLLLNKNGSWEIFGIVFTDFALWFVWFLEAFLIIGIPILLSFKYSIIPFSERLNKWYKKRILKFEFEAISTIYQFKQNIVDDPVSTITQLTYGRAFKYSEVSIFYLEDEEEHYLSVDNVYIEDNKKKNYTPIVQFLKIDPNTTKLLEDKYGAKRVFPLFY